MNDPSAFARVTRLQRPQVFVHRYFAAQVRIHIPDRLAGGVHNLQGPAGEFAFCSGVRTRAACSATVGVGSLRFLGIPMAAFSFWRAGLPRLLMRLDARRLTGNRPISTHSRRRVPRWSQLPRSCSFRRIPRSPMRFLLLRTALSPLKHGQCARCWQSHRHGRCRHVLRASTPGSALENRLGIWIPGELVWIGEAPGTYSTVSARYGGTVT
jgi:hypothetical protein